MHIVQVVDLLIFHLGLGNTVICGVHVTPTDPLRRHFYVSKDLCACKHEYFLRDRPVAIDLLGM